MKLLQPVMSRETPTHLLSSYWTLDWAIQQISAKDAYLPSTVQKLLNVMEYDVPYTAAQLMSMLGLKSRVNFRKNYIDPALEYKLIVMSIPDKPTSRNQTYIRK